MIRKILLVFWLILLFVSFSAFNTEKKPRKKIVVLDPGHGGKDTGAIGQKSNEKDIVLAIALKVGSYIQQNLPDVQVIYTRDKDVFIPLDERANIANKNNADLFVSIHANSNRSKIPYGTETYAMGLHKTQGNLEVARKENSVIVYEEDYHTKYEGFDPNSAESYIIFSLMQNTYLSQSLELASYVQNQFHEKARRKDRGVKQAGFLVLWHTSMPSILVETGFVSHEEEEDYLISPQGQDFLASAIYRAIKQYFAELGEHEEKEVKKNVTQSTITNQILTDSVVQPQVKNNNEILYRVQVSSSSNKIGSDNELYKKYQDIYEFVDNGTYKYTVGKYSSYNDVKEFQSKVREDYPGAFIVSFRDTVRIPLNEAIKIH